MTQTLAVFYEAYRSLNAKKMFWAVLLLSGLVAGSFLLVGINEEGVKILTWQINIPMLNTNIISPAAFYKRMFITYGIGYWLTWLATILALISTAGIFPDLINSGSINLLVSKPIGRLRLFATQYVAGLLFVILQVSLFTAVSFLVIGLRGGAWEPGLFLAVPLVVCFFSYLFSICVLLGLLTRSTLASLMLTILFWFIIFLLGVSEHALVSAQAWDRMGGFSAQMSRVQPPENAGELPPDPGTEPLPSPAPSITTDDQAKTAVSPPITADDQEKPVVSPPITTEAITSVSSAEKLDDQPPADDAGKSAYSERLALAHDIVFDVLTVLPKTTETIALLERNLLEVDELSFGGPPGPPGGSPGRRAEFNQAARETQSQVSRETEETFRSRSVWWIVGTSLGFEALVFCCGAWIFCRRDY
jgi:ABC-type transport system involved in multi-copper enzyme maturation permease subunit